MRGQRNQIADIAVAAGNIIHDFAQLFASGCRHIALQPQRSQIAVQIRLNICDRLVVHLLTAAIDKLDAVVVKRIMRCGNHHAAVKAVHTGDIGNARRRSDVEHIGIRAGRRQACHNRIFKHIAGTAGIFADHHAGLSALARTVVPTNELADLISVFAGQIYIGFTAKPVCSKVFTHKKLHLSQPCGRLLFSVLSRYFMNQPMFLL